MFEYIQILNYFIVKFGNKDNDGYLIVQKDNIQIHFFEFKELEPNENYGQVYIRTDEIDNLYNFFSELIIELIS